MPNTKIWSSNYPTELDTSESMPSVQYADYVDISHVNELKKAVTPSLPPTPKPLDPSTKLNIDRLQKEKVALLDGAYTSEDELIVAFDTKIQELQNK